MVGAGQSPIVRGRQALRDGAGHLVRWVKWAGAHGRHGWLGSLEAGILVSGSRRESYRIPASWVHWLSHPDVSNSA